MSQRNDDIHTVFGGVHDASHCATTFHQMYASLAAYVHASLEAF